MPQNAPVMDCLVRQPGSAPISGPATPPLIDPLADDRIDDAPLITTERRLQRLAIIAADAGARFAREGSPHDAVAWMLAPRALFDGERAIDACQDRAPFLRATLLHGLRLGLDADPVELDELLTGDDEDGAGIKEEGASASPPFPSVEGRLFTGTIECPVGKNGRLLRVFHATIAADGEVVRRGLAERYGTDLADRALVREGFDPGAPVAMEMLSPALVAWLSAVAEDPRDGGACGIDVRIERGPAR